MGGMAQGSSNTRMDRQDSLAALIEPTLAGLGYELVRVVVSGRGGTTVSIRVAVAGNMSSARASESRRCETLKRATIRPRQLSKPVIFACSSTEYGPRSRSTVPRGRGDNRDTASR